MNTPKLPSSKKPTKEKIERITPNNTFNMEQVFDDEENPSISTEIARSQKMFLVQEQISEGNFCFNENRSIKRNTLLTFAKQPQPLISTPGLFRCIKNGNRTKLKLNVKHTSGEGTFHFIGFEPLGGDDLRLLDVIVGLAAARGKQSKQGENQTLMENLGVEGIADIRVESLVFRGSWRELLANSGLSECGKNLETFKASLTRMSNVTLKWTIDRKTASFRFLSFCYGEGADEGLLVAINPLFFRTIVDGSVKYTRIDLSEVRDLKSDSALLIYHRLCAFIDSGKSTRINIQTLCEYVWGGSEYGELTDNAIKKRKVRVREALHELARIGWGILEYTPGKFRIGRSKLNVHR